MNSKLSIYPGSQREAACFFYKDYEVFQEADISMLRDDVIACFECREISARQQCKFKIFVVGTNNHGVNEFIGIAESSLLSNL
jgi:hypothetical protein